MLALSHTNFQFFDAFKYYYLNLKGIEEDEKIKEFCNKDSILDYGTIMCQLKELDQVKIHYEWSDPCGEFQNFIRTIFEPHYEVAIKQYRDFKGWRNFIEIKRDRNLLVEKSMEYSELINTIVDYLIDT